jgi:hypothetical protein
VRFDSPLKKLRLTIYFAKKISLTIYFADFKMPFLIIRTFCFGIVLGVILNLVHVSPSIKSV